MLVNIYRALAFLVAGLNVLAGTALAGQAGNEGRTAAVTFLEPPQLFAPGVASTRFAEIRLTISPDGRTALWFSRDRPGGAGGYDIWMSRRTGDGWSEAVPVPFNSAGRDFDPAFSADGRTVYFCSDRPGGMGKADLYRVSYSGGAFGQSEHLGAAVNSAGDEFAPMLSRSGRQLLFSSDRGGGAGGHDLYTARRSGKGFLQARPVPGSLNSAANEFDATFLDDRTIIFSRVMDFADGRVDLYSAALQGGSWPEGVRAAEPVNDPEMNTYGAMIDWSRRDNLLISARRNDAQGMDLYTVRYRIAPQRR